MVTVKQYNTSASAFSRQGDDENEQKYSEDERMIHQGFKGFAMVKKCHSFYIVHIKHVQFSYNSNFVEDI